MNYLKNKLNNNSLSNLIYIYILLIYLLKNFLDQIINSLKMFFIN